MDSIENVSSIIACFVVAGKTTSTELFPATAFVPGRLYSSYSAMSLHITMIFALSVKHPWINELCVPRLGV
jgi:hypothetical protein